MTDSTHRPCCTRVPSENNFKPPQVQIRKAIATLVDAGTLPAAALAQR